MVAPPPILVGWRCHLLCCSWLRAGCCAFFFLVCRAVLFAFLFPIDTSFLFSFSLVLMFSLFTACSRVCWLAFVYFRFVASCSLRLALHGQISLLYFESRLEPLGHTLPLLQRNPPLRAHAQQLWGGLLRALGPNPPPWSRRLWNTWAFPLPTREPLRPEPSSFFGDSAASAPRDNTVAPAVANGSLE